MSKKNDWIAINLNSDENLSIDSLFAYGINPNNTGLQSEDYYKSIKQVQDAFSDQNGMFDDKKFHDFYESAKRSYNDYQQSDFTQKVIDEIESSPYDIFSLGTKTMDTSAAIYRSRDPQRTTMGLGNIFEVGSPTFDIREVAQANKARDEKGNILDWSPNDKGGFVKGLFRPTMVLATYDDNGTHLENGVEVSHKKGDLKLDENGDPYYEKLGNREIYGKETLHYWDTITRDDSAWNKIDFMDSDGLTKSIGGVVARTAFSLLPYFTPIGPYLGYVGATIALGQTLPVLSKGLDGIITGTTDNNFGKTMSSLEAIMDRFGHSQSRDAMGKFLSFENIGDIVASSAGQLFQQRMIANIPKAFYKNDAASALAASKFGRNLSLGYMIATSSTDAYEIFKEAGATDRMAGIGLLGVMGGLSLLMNNDYFKDMLFTGTFMDEDIAMRDTIKNIVKENTISSFEEYAAIAPKNLSKYQQRLANTALYKQIESKVVNKLKPVFQNLAETRPTVGMLERGVLSESEKGVGAGIKAAMYLNRALNEGLEETMEEGVTDIMKAVTIGLDALGVNVTKQDQQLDFGLTLRDVLSRYGSAFLGGAIGGAVFEGFNQFEGGSYDSLLEKSLVERLVWYERNGYGQEIRDRIKRLYKQGKLGNENLSSKGTRIKSLDNKDIVVYGQGDENDNQNLFTYNVINSFLDRLDTAINDNGLFTSDNKIFDEIWKSVRERNKDNDDNPEMQLYHFLRDLDTAKALTITQMGFLNAVKEDADKLSSSILYKAAEIEKAKQQIREREHITDADSAKEKELFENSQYLKQLELELKEQKDQWNEILEGKRNGYYMGYAKMMASSKYDTLYNDPKALVNQTETFNKSGIDNWSKYQYGIEFSSVTEDELKKKIESDYEAYNKLMDSNPGSDRAEVISSWRKKSRALYDMHIKYSRRFAKDIDKLNNDMLGKKFVDRLDFLAKGITTFKGSTPAFSEQLSAFLNNWQKATSLSDSDSKEASKSFAIYQFLRSYIASDDDYSEKLKFISFLNDQIIKDNVVGIDISDLQGIAMEEILSNIKNKDEFIKRKRESRLLLDTIYDSLKTSLEDQNNLQKYIDGLTDEEQQLISTSLNNYLEAVKVDSFDVEQMELIQNILDQIELKRRPLLLGNSNAWNVDFDTKINSLIDAIVSNSDGIEERYTNLIKFILDNSNSGNPDEVAVSEQDAKKMIDDIIGKGIVDFAIKEKRRSLQVNTNPFTDLLKKFDAYTGGKLYNIIETLTKEEDYRNLLADPDKYTVSTKSKEDELTTALSFVNVIAAMINSSLDGTNELINLSDSENKLAVSNPEFADFYQNEINSLANRIQVLLNISHANKLKTTRAQQETMINMDKIRVKQLVNVGQINFGGEVIDFDAEWKKENFLLDDANLQNSKSFNKAYRNFQNRISEKLNSIVLMHAKSGDDAIINNVIKPLVDKFGTSVYLQESGELSDDPNTVIPPYAQIEYLLTISTLKTSTFDSIWKTLCKKHPELIPLYGQEFLVRSNLASLIDSKGFNLFAKLHTYLKENFPKNKIDSDGKPTHWGYSNDDSGYKYLSEREILEKFTNVDGIGGTGKTVGVGYLTQEGVKLYYGGNVSIVAMGATDEAAKGMHSALKLGKDSVNPMTFNDLKNTIDKDDNGNELFDFTTCVIVKNGKLSLRRNENGEVIDGKKRSLSSINTKKLESLFTSKDAIRLVFFDETGLLNKSDALLLDELAKRFDFFVFGSGDTIQNKATYKPKGATTDTSDGIEDCFYHKTPALTISMRSEKSGVYKNVELVKNLIKQAKHRIESEDPAYGISKFDEAIRNELNALKANSSELRLIFSDKDYSGHQLINSGSAADVAKKMLSLIDSLNEDGTQHRLAIVANDSDKINFYRNLFNSRIDKDVFVLDSKSVQGKEFDYVVVDKTFDKDHVFNAIQDFYTMMTRARRGAAIVDDGNVIRNHFDSYPDDTASENVLGSSPSEKADIYKDYNNWRMGLMEDIEEFKSPQSTSIQGSQSPQQSSQTESSESSNVDSTEDDSSVPPKVTEIIVSGTDENIDVSGMSDDEKLEYYIKRRSDKGGYYARLLYERGLPINNTNHRIDFDKFVTRLKDLTDNFFETNPLSIVQNVQLDTEDKILAHRIFIATIARAILNNDTLDTRAEYINKASKYLVSKLNRLDVDSNIVTDISSSLRDKTGFYFFKNEFVYYSFTSNDQQYAIPIAIHERADDLNGRFVEDISFDKKVGAIPITSFGEIMSPTSKILSEIDGLVLQNMDGDKSGGIEVGVVTLNETIRQKAKKHFEKMHHKDERWRKIAKAINFLRNNSGKSFIAFNGMSSEFKPGDKIFDILKDASGNYLSAIQSEYDVANSTHDAGLIGIQQLTTVENWYKVVGILMEAANHTSRQNLTPEKEQILRDFFNLQGHKIFDRFNDVVNGEEKLKNIRHNYQVLKDYRVLNHDAVDKLSSALFRYILARNPKWGKRYLQNFTKWLQYIKREEDENYHRRGFTVQFDTTQVLEDNSKTTITHTFTIVPKVKKDNDKSEIVGFETLYSDSDNPGWESVYNSVGKETFTKLFSNTNYDFVKAIYNVFKFPFSNESVANLVKDFTDDDIEKGIGSGKIIVYPVDLQYNADEDIGLPQYVWTPYETDIFRWLTKGENGENLEISSVELNDLDKFLRSDTTFKNNMYRNIKAIHSDEKDEAGWGLASGVTLDNSYVDIIKLIAPLYEMKTAKLIEQDSKKALDLKSKLSGFFEKTESIDGNSAAFISKDTIININDNVAEFDDPQEVNLAWLREYVDNFNETGKQFKIKGYNILSQSIIIGDKSFKLNEKGKTIFLESIPGLSNEIKELVITGINNELIVNNSIKVNDTIYGNVELIGINQNRYTFKSNNELITIAIDNEQARKLNGVKSIKNLGIYIGTIEDSGQRLALYINGEIINCKDLKDFKNEDPKQYRVNELSRTDNGFLLSNIPINDPSIIDELEVYFSDNKPVDLKSVVAYSVGNNGLHITLGNHTITAIQLRSLLKNPQVNNDKIYHILAFSGTRVGYYENDDVSTFKWGESKDFDFNDLVVRSGDDLGFVVDETDIPGSIIRYLEDYKSNAIDEFNDMRSKTDSLRYKILQNGMIIDTVDTKATLIVKQKRTVWNWLNDSIQDVSNVLIYRNVGETEDSPLTVEYTVNGKKERKRVRIVGDSVSIVSNEKMNTFEAAKKEFSDLLNAYQQRYNELNNIKEQSILTQPEALALQNELNVVSNLLSTLTDIKKELEQSKINRMKVDKLIDNLNDEDAEMIASNYWEAITKQSEC